MAAPYTTDGLVSKAVQWSRTWANDPIVSGQTPKFSNDRIMELMYESIDTVIEDLYGSADAPPYVEFPITFVSGQSLYLLPPNCKEVHRIVGRTDDELRNLRWELIPGSRLSAYGPSYTLEGTRFLRLDPPPDAQAVAGRDATVEYIPGGAQLVHQAATPLWTGDNDTGTQILFNDNWRLNYTTNAWRIGRVDRRPWAYHGCQLRVLGCITESVSVPGYFAFPLQERQLHLASHLFASDVVLTAVFGATTTTVTAVGTPFTVGMIGADILFASGNRFRIATFTNSAVVTVQGDAHTETGAFTVVGGVADFTPEPSLDFDPRACVDKQIAVQVGDTLGRTYLVYEILPDIDRALIDIAMLDVAMSLCGINGRREQVAVLERKRAKRLRTAQLRWSNMQMRTGDHYDTAEADDTDTLF